MNKKNHRTYNRRLRVYLIIYYTRTEHETEEKKRYSDDDQFYMRRRRRQRFTHIIFDNAIIPKSFSVVTLAVGY